MAVGLAEPPWRPGTRRAWGWAEGMAHVRFSSHNLGIGLAVLAGCLTLAEAVWPGSAPQSQSLNFWLPLAVVSGCAFLLSAYLVDRHPILARALLAVGGLFLLSSGVFFSLISGGGGRSAVALIADLTPGLLALVSAVVIGPTERRAYP
jgi:hypothetical protein